MKFILDYIALAKFVNILSKIEMGCTSLLFSNKIITIQQFFLIYLKIELIQILKV